MITGDYSSSDSDSRDIFVGMMQKLIMLGMNKRKAPGRTTMMMLPDKKAAEIN
jgi:thioester reductase-like protein